MKWKIEIWEEQNEDKHNYTDWASSFFEAFGLFSAYVMDESCYKCIVTAYHLDKPYGDSPVLAYDNQ